MKMKEKNKRIYDKKINDWFVLLTSDGKKFSIKLKKEQTFLPIMEELAFLKKYDDGFLDLHDFASEVYFDGEPLETDVCVFSKNIIGFTPVDSMSVQ